MSIYRIKRADGGISYLRLLSHADAEAEVARWAISANPEWLPVAGYEEVDEASISADRTFREAWGHDGGVRMDVARGIHRDRLRALRGPKFAALDVGYMRALEAGDSVAAGQIAAQKQALRDVTKDPAIDAAQTPGELSSVMPEVLA